MTDYPAGNKTADQCTYGQMIERFRWEIHRAIRLEWDVDGIASHQHNLEVFQKDYRDMLPDETIQTFKERRTGCPAT